MRGGAGGVAREGARLSEDRRLATSFGAAAAEYERGRPGYPAAAVDLLARELALDPHSVVVDLAAGTGKLTRELIGRVGRVIAVEPLEAMLRELERQVPQAEAVAGTAEQMPLDTAVADAVLVAQAFHWFDGPSALTEIARVLRPGGGLGLVWNMSPWERRVGSWYAALDGLLESHRADLSVRRRQASGAWKEAFREDDLFAPLASATVANEQRISATGFIAGLASRSYVLALEPAERERFLRDVESLLERPDAPREGDAVVVPMTTHVYWTHLRQASSPRSSGRARSRSRRTPPR